ncbi:MAG: hypothetical protein ACHQ1D_01015 [Nitrososphaerales archaeon]
MNVAIPLGIIVFLAGAVWWRMREPMGAFFKWLGEMFGSAKDKLADSAGNAPTEIIYR